jgi:putative ABC transport system permease protein
MYFNYLLIAFRSFRKNKAYSLLNVSGLAVSLAVAALIILYIGSEKNHDRWIANQSNIYRVYRQWGNSGGSAWTPSRLAHTLRQQYPEIAHATRLDNYGEALITLNGGEKSLYVDHAVLTDSSLFAVLPLPFASGDPATALDQPYSAVLSQELAHKLFEGQNPLGKVIRFNDQDDYRVTGVLARPAGPMHLDADVFLKDQEGYGDSWTGNSPTTYVALHPEANVARLERKVTAGINKYLKAEFLKTKVNVEELPKWRLQPLGDIHLYSAKMNGPFETKGDYRNLYLLGGVAVVILLVAGINYMNMTTAQAARRAREVGVRKASGASREQLVGQFMAESVVQCFTALPLAVVLAGLFLPAFNQMTDRNLTLHGADWLRIAPYWAGVVLVLGLLSGSYPAFFLAAYRPVEVLKGNLVRRTQGHGLRQTLVVTQFSVAIAVAIVMTFVYRQVQFMLDQELGFQPSQVVAIPLNTDTAAERIVALKPRLLQNPRVESISYSTSVPGKFEPDYGFEIKGVDKSQYVDIYFVEPDFARTLNLTLAQGRFFAYDHPSDTANAYVVNEAFVRTYGLKNPVGHQMRFSGRGEYGTIVGVVKDFHFHSLQSTIGPLVFYNNPKVHGMASYAVIRIASGEVPATLAAIKRLWKEVEPAHPMRYSFLDDEFAKLYADHTRLGQTMLYATLLTIFIASLGLFGLVSFMAEQRTKEIGVRKVLGASEWQIVLLLGKNFLKLVGIAGLVATPVAFLVAREWLADFAYRTPVTVVPFLLAVGLALLVATLTVSFRSYRAALANPVKSLRTE